MKTKGKDKEQVSAHLNRTLLKRISKMAEQSHRTLSGQISFLLELGLSNLSKEEQQASFISNEV